MKGSEFVQSHADFFVLFRPWMTASDSYQSRRQSMVVLGSISPKRGVKFPCSFSTYQHQNALLSLGITIALRQVTQALLCQKNKDNLQKQLEVLVGVRKKMPGDRAEFQKELQGMAETKSPVLDPLAPNLTKARETKRNLRNEHNSRKKR